MYERPMEMDGLRRLAELLRQANSAATSGAAPDVPSGKPAPRVKRLRPRPPALPRGDR